MSKSVKHSMLEKFRERFPLGKRQLSIKARESLQLESKSKTDSQPTHNTDDEDDEDLWTLAYNLLKKGTPTLVEKYNRKVLSLKCINKNSSDPLSDIETTREIVSALAKAHEDKQWNVPREQVEKLVKFALGCNSIIRLAAKSQPYTTLAWSGVSVFLSLLSDGLEQAEVMLDGFNCTYLKVSIIKLYELILKYQAIVICRLPEGQMKRAWDATDARWKDER
ncbi:hypothetical protein TSTA_036410 [Talaromyces stipitatus ATCC 10500]|uniref:NWD NACHT-NTPase N-terminal domain-containing protein n=1 Tax=Talaromyces stipitatus (strain ATCC 10500 / CBS 375.48 / QM 6759 / NRRL 1006) TaxID=441959 RepID=B8M8A2_TALSN|nr:uncharacterized protein TSTA_036410 [Talaromyces stipitatus ATCC 10500]EED20415.1 hypothetical protein TSTA_036410 [Talaromyces stipitatus ATCC 10500]